jgi:hypothetical protein
MYWLYFRSGVSFLFDVTMVWGGARFVISVKHDPWGTLGTVASHHIPRLLVLPQEQFLLFLKKFSLLITRVSAESMSVISTRPKFHGTQANTVSTNKQLNPDFRNIILFKEKERLCVVG